jgi:SH3 domain-containing YSC84-like protein 1
MIFSKSSGFDHLSAAGIKKIRHMVAAFCLALVVSTVAQGQAESLRDGVNQSGKAARVFREIMEMSGRSIPRELLEDSVCVAVFPAGGVVIGGCGSHGVVSCRTAKAWSAPAFLDLSGGSFEQQVGAPETDFVMLVMSGDGLNSLFSDEVALGANVSVAAGPVGRLTGALTDQKLEAQILSYSRSKGLLAGLELEDVVLKLDEEEMRDVYGEGVTAKEVLTKIKVTAPVAVWAFPMTLWHYSSGKENSFSF